jgi:LysR family nitrogen assimilation transcriptional regulator
MEVRATDPTGFDGDFDLPLTDGLYVSFLDPKVPCSNFVRRAVDTAFGRSKATLRVVAEVEIVRTLGRAVERGVGATIMPKAIADRLMSESTEPLVRRVVSPRIEETLSLCVSDQMPLSEPAQAVSDILKELARRLQVAET